MIAPLIPMPPLKTFLPALLFLAASATAAEIPSPEAIAALTQWIAHPAAQRPTLAGQDFARAPLSRTDAENASRLLWEDHAARIRESRSAEIEARCIEIDGRKLRFDFLRFGEKDKTPAGGHALFISMHGGGGAPSEVNESQWRNQVKLGNRYHPSEGIYLAPRAPGDTWDLWHEKSIDPLFARLLEDLIVLEGVDANRVYLMGYSAGGDGVYQVAPRMADRFAAAAMMAGHPNEASPLGLMNLPFAIQVGANDAAYHRNEIAAQWGQKLDALAAANPGLYAHFTELHAGKGHWMDMDDRKAIPWMEGFTREPLPKKIAWHQDDVTHGRFYWLAVSEPKEGEEIFAQRNAQSIEISAARKLTVRLNDTMLNLDEPVRIAFNGAPVFNARCPRTILTLQTTLEETGDRHLMFSAEHALP